MVPCMGLTDLEDMVSPARDGAVQLDVAAYDRLAHAKGKRTRSAQAKWHGLARSAFYLLLGGGNPSAPTAARMAADCEVPFEAIWKRVAA